MKTKYIFLYCLLFICNAVTAQKVITGAEQMDRLLPILKGKRVALVVNQTSKVGETHLLDTLLAAHIQIKKVFAPEHGFRGRRCRRNHQERKRYPHGNTHPVPLR